ncbi:YggT family protein [Chloroflexota bacterium]
MGRPWWYESYWERGKKQKRNLQSSSGRPFWVWTAVLLLVLLLTIGSGGFYLSVIPWFLGYVYNLCRILTFSIFLRAILSWFTVNPYNILVVLLDDINKPILSPLRRIVPMLGLFDITPLIAIAIMYVIPPILNAILS